MRANGLAYQGINVLLWATAMEKGYSAPIWITYNQPRTFCQARKDEHSTHVVSASLIVDHPTQE